MSEIRVNKVINAAGSDAPNFPYGFSVAAGYGITGGGNITGTAATFSGAVNIDATTDSTSTTTGALIVDGGLGVAKNVYIGAGLSVAGTLTYEDVTNVDSVGVITAKSGVNISGGELLVGSNIKGGTAGVLTATTFVGALTGNVTGNINGNLTGTLQTAAQTNVTSVGTLAGLTVGSAGEFKVGTALTMASTSGVATFSNDVYFANPADSTKYAQWNPSNDRLNFQDNAQITWGNGSDLKIYHDGSNSYIDEAGTGSLKIRSGTDSAIVVNTDDSVQIYWDGSERIRTTGAGTTCVGITTVQDFSSYGMLKERVEIVANKLSAGVNIDLEKGNIWYYSTNETTTATPNIRYSSSKTLNNAMLVGEAVTVTIIYKPNGAGYYAQLAIDGSASTEEWNGGSAPSAANAGGYDVLTHTIIKTGSGSWINLSNVQNYA